MGEETTWFDLLPGVRNLELFVKHYLERDKLGVAMFPSAFSMTHVFEVFCVLHLRLPSARSPSRAATRRATTRRHRSAAKLTLRNLFEMFTDAVFGVADGVMGEKNARRFLPLIGTLAFFIFFSNLFALIPGFAPPTATLKTNVGAGAAGVRPDPRLRRQGARPRATSSTSSARAVYLAPLMLPIEIISHLARPLSLSLRLLGNMVADHKVVGSFFTLVPLLVPLPFLMLGVLV